MYNLIIRQGIDPQGQKGNNMEKTFVYITNTAAWTGTLENLGITIKELPEIPAEAAGRIRIYLPYARNIHAYSVTIIAENEAAADHLMDAQIDDGAFENNRGFLM